MCPFTLFIKCPDQELEHFQEQSSPSSPLIKDLRFSLMVLFKVFCVLASKSPRAFSRTEKGALFELSFHV